MLEFSSLGYSEQSTGVSIMANFKAGVTISAVMIALGSASNALAYSPTITSSTTNAKQVNSVSSLMRTYSSPQKAINAMAAAGRQDLLDGTISGLSAEVSNPSSDIESLGWYALFGSDCCLVVLKATEETSVSISAQNDTPIRELLQNGRGLALISNRDARQLAG